jgi:hypothetical protein
METNEQEEFRKKERRYKAIIGILIALCIVLLIFLVISRVKVHTIVVTTEQINTRKLELKTELDSLLKEHERIKTENVHITKALKDKDSLIQADADEIKDLLNYKYDYNKIKKKLDRLRLVAQNYVHQMDSLYTANRVLKNENVEIKEHLNKEKEKNVALVKEKANRAEKVNLAALLKAYSVTAEPIHKRNEKKQDVTDKARRTDLVKVCFTLSENTVAPPGKRMIYVRIARPDNVIVTGGTEAETFLFNGQKIQFSMKQEVEYDGKAQKLCLSWAKKDKDAKAMEGVYHVAVFCDDYEIGQATFELK